jgi:hypothetical protein
MNNMAATILTAAIAQFPDAACTFRLGFAEWGGMCTGLDEIKTATDQGNVAGYSGNARYLASVEPAIVSPGDVVDVKRAQDETWLKLRVSARHQTGGAVRLTVMAEYE